MIVMVMIKTCAEGANQSLSDSASDSDSLTLPGCDHYWRGSFHSAPPLPFTHSTQKMRGEMATTLDHYPQDSSPSLSPIPPIPAHEMMMMMMISRRAWNNLYETWDFKREIRRLNPFPQRTFYFSILKFAGQPTSETLFMELVRKFFRNMGLKSGLILA